MIIITPPMWLTDNIITKRKKRKDLITRQLKIEQHESLKITVGAPEGNNPNIIFVYPLPRPNLSSTFVIYFVF